MFALTPLNSRIANWRRDTLLFLPSEIEDWQREEHQAVLLLSTKGPTGFLVWLDEVQPLSPRFHYTPWLHRPRRDLSQLADLETVPRRVNLYAPRS